MKIKVCGLNNPENILSLLPLQPDYAGFIFYKKSPRYFSLPGFDNIPFGKTKKCGVFVNENPEVVLKIINQYALDAVQLHGEETSEYAHRIQQGGAEVIKAFSIYPAFRFEMTLPYVNSCDYFLFDTKGKNYGGNGKKFNHGYLKHYHNQKPFFLSGGIGPEDLEPVKEIQNSGANIHGVDINSRFEISPGIKNIEIINQFINQINCQCSSAQSAGDKLRIVFPADYAD
ncbi:MAG: phosphoribosylanthranilate isomerase [Bacteroidota bacterium]